jgi:2-polyprenyl-3-methyl-5-hydroxy-6-metoxy-1,4-benzoquinol methylase
MHSDVQCPVCGSDAHDLWATARDVEYCTSEASYNYRQCQACKVLFIDPVPIDSLQQIYPPNYYSYASPTGSAVHRVKNWLDRRFFSRILRGVSGANLSVLDVGGGAGWELSSVRDCDARITSTCIVDMDPAAAAVARQNGHEYYCGRVEDFTTDMRYDVVMMLNVIEHVNDPAEVLRKIFGLIRPGGIAVLKTPNYDALDARIFRHKSWAGLHCPRHWVLFTRESFASVAQRAGFTVREASYTQGAPFWSASVLALLSAKGVVRVSADRPAIYHPLFKPIAAAFAGLDFARRPFAKTSQMFFVLQA